MFWVLLQALSRVNSVCVNRWRFICSVAFVAATVSNASPLIFAVLCWLSFTALYSAVIFFWNGLAILQSYQLSYEQMLLFISFWSMAFIITFIVRSLRFGLLGPLIWLICLLTISWFFRMLVSKFVWSCTASFSQLFVWWACWWAFSLIC